MSPHKNPSSEGEPDNVKAKMGRPTSLTPELKDKICSYIRGGSYIETAVLAVGISKQTFFNWMHRANDEVKRINKTPRARIRKSEEIYIDFLDSIEKAQAESEVKDILRIEKAAGSGQWQASAWRLERKNPDRWGRRDKIRAELEHSGETKVRFEIIKAKRDENEGDSNDK